MTAAKSRKKLIEVALPLDAINKAAAEQSPKSRNRFASANRPVQDGSPALMSSQLPRHQRHRAKSISHPSRP